MCLDTSNCRTALVVAGLLVVCCRGQHRVNDEDGGTVLSARPVDVHSHSYGIDVNKGKLLGWLKFNKV